jgi:hypothetical protein
MSLNLSQLVFKIFKLIYPLSMILLRRENAPLSSPTTILFSLMKSKHVRVLKSVSKELMALSDVTLMISSILS